MTKLVRRMRNISGENQRSRRPQSHRSAKPKVSRPARTNYPAWPYNSKNLLDGYNCFGELAFL